MTGADAELVRISLVAHHAFCPRRAWLESRGERTDSGQVAQGVADHTAVDDVSTSRAERLRSVDIRSEELALTGRCDTVELTEDGSVFVVEHKSAPVRRRSDPTEPQRIQLALQAICLEELGRRVDGAGVWFSTTRRRVDVPLGDELMARARAEVAATRAVVQARTPPAPLEDDPRCGRCSHVSVCLPDEHRRRPTARRIGVADPSGRVLHLNTPGSRASLSRGQIQVRSRDQPSVTVPLGQIAGLVVHGNADVSSALIRETLERGFGIVWCAWSGRVVGWANPANGPNGDARRMQHRLDERLKAVTAQAIVAAKIRNQSALLRRHASPSRVAMHRLAEAAEKAPTRDALFGLEGRAAAIYFGELTSALRPGWASIAGRAHRPAPDPVNAALNVVYGLLLSDVLRAVVACGLDPSGGALHTAGRNKPALALDLMEELRAPIGDSAVLWAINNGEIRERDFQHDLDAVRLTPRGRKALIAAYERRATTEFRHPQFGYRVTWRRAMEVQARMFLAMVLGETDLYRPLLVR